MSKQHDQLAAEFGVARADDFFPDAESSERREKFRTIDRQIETGEIPLLADDELADEDDLLPRDFYEAWHGPYPDKHALPVNRQKTAERAAQLKFEAENGGPLHEPPQQKASQVPSGEELQERLFSEFEAEFGRVDRNEALRAAHRLAEQGKSYQFDNRSEFYSDIAREMGVSRRASSKRTADDDNDDNGRSVLPSAGGRGAPQGSAKRSDEPGDFLRELNEGREGGFF